MTHAFNDAVVIPNLAKQLCYHNEYRTGHNTMQPMIFKPLTEIQQSGKDAVDSLYNFTHRAAQRASEKTINTKLDDMVAAWNALDFAGDATGNVWRDQYLHLFNDIKSGVIIGHERFEIMHSACGALNQTLRDAIN